MAFQQVLSGVGPLPIKAQFSVPIDGSVDFFVTSTAWTQSQNVNIGIQVSVNGEYLGTANMFANPSGQHMTLPTIFGTVNIADPTAQQTITITASTSDTVTDVNDVFLVWAQY